MNSIFSLMHFSNTYVIGIQCKPQFLCIKDLKIADCVDSSKDFNLQELNIDAEKLIAFADNKESVVNYFNKMLWR
jgi:hypothetical protein